MSRAPTSNGAALVWEVWVFDMSKPRFIVRNVELFPGSRRHARKSASEPSSAEKRQ
ncbi:hypothetical protein EMIT0P260_30165 [Pseudomonas sp. IT-P260]